MSTDTFDRGPLQNYEIIWRSGHVETVQGHSVQLPWDPGVFGGKPRPFVTIYGEFDGRWLLVLHAREEDITSVRILPADAPERAS